MKRPKPTDAQLAWTMYLINPPEVRVAASYADLTPYARALWLALAHKHLAAGGLLDLEP